MTNLQDMQDKTVEVELAGMKFIAQQLFSEDWAQVERELASEKVSISDLLSGVTSIIGFRALIKIAIKCDIPPKTKIQEIFATAGAILNLDIPAEGISPAKNSQATPEAA